jgi:hypothetical protein
MKQLPRRRRRDTRVRPYAPEPTPGSVCVPEDLLLAFMAGAISLCRRAVGSW